MPDIIREDMDGDAESSDAEVPFDPNDNNVGGEYGDMD